MRLSDERLALLARHRSLALAEDVRALVAEVRALKECEAALRGIVDNCGPVSFESVTTPVQNWALLSGRAALAGVRALEGEHFVCPECGPHVKADEDGCCTSCGRDCRVEGKP